MVAAPSFFSYMELRSLSILSPSLSSLLSSAIHALIIRIDIRTRVESICQKYDKYDIDKQKDLNLSGDDAFARLYASVESDIEAALQKAETANNEKSKASAVAINAELRRTKARLLEEVPKLQRLAMKKELSIGMDCDIALLSVEREEFCTGTRPLKLGQLPSLQI